MANQTGTSAGTAGMSEQNNTALPENSEMIGHIEPLIGRVAQRDVSGYFGFPLIKKGDVVTRSVAERAQNMARLFELIAATEDR